MNIQHKNSCCAKFDFAFIYNKTRNKKLEEHTQNYTDLELLPEALTIFFSIVILRFSFFFFIAATIVIDKPLHDARNTQERERERERVCVCMWTRCGVSE